VRITPRNLSAVAGVAAFAAIVVVGLPMVGGPDVPHAVLRLSPLERRHTPRPVVASAEIEPGAATGASAPAGVTQVAPGPSAPVRRIVGGGVAAQAVDAVTVHTTPTTTAAPPAPTTTTTAPPPSSTTTMTIDPYDFGPSTPSVLPACVPGMVSWDLPGPWVPSRTYLVTVYLAPVPAAVAGIGGPAAAQLVADARAALVRAVYPWPDNGALVFTAPIGDDICLLAALVEVAHVTVSDPDDPGPILPPA